MDEIKTHSQEQIERLKQQVEETNLELQIKEREMKKMKFMQLIKEKPSGIEGYSHSISLAPHPMSTRNQHDQRPIERFRTLDNGSMLSRFHKNKSVDLTRLGRMNEREPMLFEIADEVFEKSLPQSSKNDKNSSSHHSTPAQSKHADPAAAPNSCNSTKNTPAKR